MNTEKESREILNELRAIRLSPSENQQVKEAATNKGVTVSEYIREAMREAIRRKM
jgi:predicted DNA-binding protein